MTYKTNKPSKAKWSGIIFAATFLAFPILQFIVFYLGVNVKSWISAFQPEFGEGFSFINFRLFFIELTDPLNAMSSTIKNTFITFGVYDFISLPLCVFFSYVLYKKVAASSFFRVVFYFPSLLSIVALALVFYFIVDVKGPIALEFNLIGLNYPSPFGREGFGFCMDYGFLRMVGLRLFDSAFFGFYRKASRRYFRKRENRRLLYGARIFHYSGAASRAHNFNAVHFKLRRGFRYVGARSTFNGGRV